MDGSFVRKPFPTEGTNRIVSIAETSRDLVLFKNASEVSLEDSAVAMGSEKRNRNSRCVAFVFRNYKAMDAFS